MLFKRKKATDCAKNQGDSEKRFHFEKLAPVDNADIDVYEEAIEFAFENEDVRSVAISGAYGSGKSSLLASYKKKHPEKEFIHISLAHFEPEYKEKNIPQSNNTPSKTVELGKKLDQPETLSKPSESVLEGKILNQLIHQIKEDDIPQTNFRVKKTLTKKQVIWQSIAMLSLMVTIIHLALSYVWINFVSTFTAGCWFRNILELTTTPGSFFVSGCVGLVIISYFVVSLVKRQRFKATIRKLSLQGNDIELFENENNSFFDKYLNEVLYLFENAGVDAIVFEDMDRYDMEGIFERLHEVNTLANIRLNRKGKKNIRFFYLVRDDLFVSKDRTKFFDYIIPVIPIVDSSNSYNQFIRLMQLNKLRDLFEEKFLQGLSLYIDDMRLLKNICNEFLIYHNRLSNTELAQNKLLAMIAYKNIFPRDFSDLQMNRGFIYTVFANKEAFIKGKVLELQKRIDEIDEKIERIENNHLRNLRELDAVFVDKYFTGYSVLSYRDEQLRQWIKSQLSGQELKEYEQRQQDLEDGLAGKVLLLRQQKQEILSQQQKLKQRKLSEIIDRENVDEVFSIESKNVLGEEKKFEEVKRNQYFNLLKYLIWNGYIDETYADYMTYFYPNSITTSDKVFLQSLTNKIAKPYTFEIKKPCLVFQKLNVYDFDEPEILNFVLLTYILRHEPAKECLQHLIEQLRTTGNYSFVSQYLDCTSEKEKFVIAVNAYWPEFFSAALEKTMMSKQKLWEYSHDTLYYSPDEDIKRVNADGCLEKYISSQFDYLIAPVEQYDKLMHGLIQLGVKFQKIDYTQSNHDLFMLVYEQSCYALNYDNIALILQYVYGITAHEDIRHKNLTLISSNKDSALYKYIMANIDEYFSEMLSFCSDRICDDEAIAVSVLNNSVLPQDTKIAYIGSLVTQLSVLEDIDKKTLWADILKAGVADCNENNIWDYWEEAGIDQVLVSFINDGKTKLNFRPLIDQNGQKKGGEWFNDIMASNEICTDRYIEILKSCGLYHSKNFAIMGIADDKMERLVDENLVRLSDESLQFIRVNYPAVRYRFINKHFDVYIESMSQTLFDYDELLEVLSWDVPDEKKYKLIAFTNKSISVVDKGYSTSVTRYILQNHPDINDMPRLCAEYSRLADEIRPIIINHAKFKIDDILNNQLSSSYDLNLALLKQSDVSESKKYELLLKMLSSVNRLQGKACFECMLLNEFVKVFEVHAKPKILKNDKNEKILDVLVYRGWIYDYPDYPYDCKYYTVRRNAPSKKKTLTKV